MSDRVNSFELFDNEDEEEENFVFRFFANLRRVGASIAQR